MLGNDHPATVTTINNLALVQRRMRAFDKSLALYQRALEINEKARGPKHPSTATSLANLGDLYRTMDAHDKALPLFQRALAIREKALGSEDGDTRYSRNELASLYEDMGALDKALPLYRRELAVSEKVDGREDPNTANSLDNLGGLYESMRAYDKALPLLQRALAIREKAFGSTHPDITASVDNIAVLYESMGALEKALPLRQRALAINEKAGHAGPTIDSLENLAELYESMGALEKALPLRQRALAINEKAGHAGPTADSLENLAELYESMGALDKALPLLQRALAMRDKTSAPKYRDSRGRVNRLNALVNGYVLIRAYDEALPMLQEVLAISERTRGPEHPKTAEALYKLARLHTLMGDYDKALPLNRRALEISERLQKPKQQPNATQLNFSGQINQAMGAYDEALVAFEHALAVSGGTQLVDQYTSLRRRNLTTTELKERAARYYEYSAREEFLSTFNSDTATSLNNLGGLYFEMGIYDKALPHFQRALAIREKVLDPQHPDTATSLNDLSQLYVSMGAYQKALPLVQRALKISQNTNGPESLSVAASLSALGGLYHSMGAYDKALPLFERALSIKEKALGSEHPSTARSLNDLAGVYGSMDAYDKALPIAQQALSINENVLGSKNRSTADSLNQLGALYLSMHAYDKALPRYQSALAIREKALGPQHPSTASSLNNLAVLYESMGADDKALPLYQRALAIALGRMRAGADPELLRNVAGNFCWLSAAASPPRTEEAIFYCKLAVNAGQFQRAGARGLDRELRESLAKSIDNPYRQLAKLLTESGRLVEAEQVLLALKDAEYVEFVRGPPAGGADPVALTREEKPLANEINALADSLAKVYAELDAHRRKAAVLTPEALSQRQEQRDLLQQQLLAKLGEISARLKATDNETATALAPYDTRLTRLVNRLTGSTYGESSVVVMYAPEKQVTTVLVTGPSGPTALQLPVGSNTLNPLIDEMHRAIQDKKDYRPQAQALYEYLISPVEAHLGTGKLKPKTLMLYLTGRLRYLPFAALVDDKGSHLIQKYRLAVLTAAARDQADTDPILHWSVTAFGRTQPASGLSALPAVEEELKGIVRTPSNPKGTLPGQPLLNADFTLAAWQAMLNARPGAGNARNSVVHVATHFQSQPGDWNRSFLLLGTGEERYDVSELDRGLSINLDDVDLITLSACATELTGKADGKEFEGLGAVFQKKGAKAVIGTLWKVQDEGAAALMKAFYSARGEERQMSKAAALQSAQVQLLTGTIKSGNPLVDLTHPYYWAPFILMGNWL